jgi:cell division initiation protein
MKITPVDVAHKVFSKTLYGLDQREVLNYLQSLADQLETLIRERNELRERLRDKEIQISEYKDRDQLLKNTLTTASQMSERIREESEKKAELTLQEAQIRANDVQKATHESLRKAYTEINDLRTMRIQFETNIRALAHAHLALLAEGQKYMGMPQTPPSTGQEVFSSKLTTEISPLAADMI